MRWWRWRTSSGRRVSWPHSRAASTPRSASFPADGRRDAMKGNNPALGLFILRVVVGVVFLMHGLGKLIDRKSTRLNSSHLVISYAVFCLKKKIDMASLAARPVSLD